MRKRNVFTRRRIIIFLSLVCLAVAAAFLVKHIRFETPRIEPLMLADEPEIPASEPAISDIDDIVIEAPPEEAVDVEVVAEDNLPHDRLFITVERQRYKAGDLRLVIPRISFDKSLEPGTSSDELGRGPGLYDYAQLPGEGNRNVSIAGHRRKRDFYYVDIVTERDYIYLVDAENIYRYIHESSFVVTPDDWGPIYSQGFSCVTLTTCTPIGISDHRLIVRGELDAIFPYTEDFVFEMSGPEEFESDGTDEEFA